MRTEFQMQINDGLMSDYLSIVIPNLMVVVIAAFTADGPVDEIRHIVTESDIKALILDYSQGLESEVTQVVEEANYHIGSDVYFIRVPSEARASSDSLHSTVINMLAHVAAVSTSVGFEYAEEIVEFKNRYIQTASSMDA